MGDLIDPSERLSVVLADLGVREKGEDGRVLEGGRSDRRCVAVLEPVKGKRSTFIQDVEVWLNTHLILYRKLVSMTSSLTYRNACLRGMSTCSGMKSTLIVSSGSQLLLSQAL